MSRPFFNTLIFTLVFSVIHFPNVSFGVDLDDALNSVEKKMEEAMKELDQTINDLNQDQSKKENQLAAEKAEQERLAAEKAEMDTEFEKSEEAKKNKNWVLAKDIVEPLAEKGHAKSQGRLGGIYLMGFGGVPKDLKKAFKWLKLGAEQGDATAQGYLGAMYYEGKGVSQDYKEALKWFRLAAEQGDTDAQFNLGLLYYEGKGVSQDYKEAATLLKPLSEEGYGKASIFLGVLYLKGNGVSKNKKKAIKLFRLGYKNLTEQEKKERGEEISREIEKLEEEVEEERLAKAAQEKREKEKAKKEKLAAELIKVQKYILEKEYPDVFGEKKIYPNIVDAEIVDFGNDGLVEVIILYRPYYLQSPTIVIYQIQKDGSVKRIREALAPGPLVKRTNDFLDSHELGEGVDFNVGKAISYVERKTAAKKIAAEIGGLVVQYKNFYHTDGRKGKSTYIDMSHVEPFDSEQTCAFFEFSKVDSISVGVGSREDNKNLGAILAKVGNQVYVYEIAGIDKDGYLDKTLSIRK